jgi:branched-chain amino acid transport system ATP-binding protein
VLEVDRVCVAYGGTQVLWDVSLRVGASEIVAVMGPNGSGKSTLFKAIIGLAKVRSGTVTFEGRDITNQPPHTMVDRGIALVLERRRLFGAMTVRENLLMGAFGRRARSRIQKNLEVVRELLPQVIEMQHRPARELSGGQQQLVAIGRGLMSEPRLLIMDEPLLGLTPKMVKEVIELVRRLKAQGIAVLFNEQNVRVSFGNSDHGCVLEAGRLVLQGSGLEMLEHPTVKRVYLGATQVDVAGA